MSHKVFRSSAPTGIRTVLWSIPTKEPPRISDEYLVKCPKCQRHIEPEIQAITGHTQSTLRCPLCGKEGLEDAPLFP